MPTCPDADLTIPSIAAALPGSDRGQQLLLTIIFHPDTNRIGERALVHCPAGAPDWVLGRRSPEFVCPAGLQSGPLAEGHVSRQALAFSRTGEQLLLRRFPASSRCRVDGRELDGAIELDTARLRRGVPILLGHGVVLLLRLAQREKVNAAAFRPKAFCGSSMYMAGLFEQISRVARSELDVLVRGETGTGKELVASAIHQASNRHSAPLVSVNMAAIPAGLAASALFGSTRGAFTGANSASGGYFAQAENSTLFLDEIGDTPAEVQPQLLRALQEREIQVVGGAIRKVSVRVISATDAVLDAQTCDFKAALRHRLGACEIVLRPLREHPEDIGELLLHFLRLHCERENSVDTLPLELTSARDVAAWAELFHSFLVYSWPGNVRELANFASQVVVASCTGLTLPDNIRRALLDDVANNTGVGAGGSTRSQLRNIREVEEAEFDSALKAGDFEVANVARQLGVSRQSVYRRMEDSSRYRLASQIPLAELTAALALRGGDARATAADLQVSASGLRTRLRSSELVWF